ncbi:MAG: polyprenyl synthetase family protein [Planctomycetota bacterium]|jgi:geranylgeranyl diphosphate synthase type II|nr:polyprenyl synthetase family protein [Planctomycetota bacterium]
MDRLRRFMREVAAQAETRLEGMLPYPDLRPETLHQAMRHAVLGGGKRLRPVITLAAFTAAGGREEDRPGALDAGCAIELLHCYSLTHDDLPAMDNDTLRRNRLTCHKAFGEAMAILAGDALHTLAYGTLARASGPLAADTVAELSRAAGSTGMAGGQALDLEGEGKRQVVEEIERIDRWKTGSIFTCCCRIGAILAGAGDSRLAALSAYGDALGVLYQISDDILDLTAGAETIGKTPGKDRNAGKLTYPAALGLDGARAVMGEKRALALDAIGDFGREALYLRLFADFLAERIVPGSG